MELEFELAHSAGCVRHLARCFKLTAGWAVAIQVECLCPVSLGGEKGVGVAVALAEGLRGSESVGAGGGRGELEFGLAHSAGCVRHLARGGGEASAGGRRARRRETTCPAKGSRSEPSGQQSSEFPAGGPRACMSLGGGGGGLWEFVGQHQTDNPECGRCHRMPHLFLFELHTWVFRFLGGESLSQSRLSNQQL